MVFRATRREGGNEQKVNMGAGKGRCRRGQGGVGVFVCSDGQC